MHRIVVCVYLVEWHKMRWRIAIVFLKLIKDAMGECNFIRCQLCYTLSLIFIIVFICVAFFSRSAYVSLRSTIFVITLHTYISVCTIDYAVIVDSTWWELFEDRTWVLHCDGLDHHCTAAVFFIKVYVLNIVLRSLEFEQSVYSILFKNIFLQSKIFE